MSGLPSEQPQHCSGTDERLRQVLVFRISTTTDLTRFLTILRLHYLPFDQSCTLSRLAPCQSTTEAMLSTNGLASTRCSIFAGRRDTRSR